MTRKKIIWIVVLTILVLGTGLFFAYPKIKSRISAIKGAATNSDNPANQNGQNSAVDSATGQPVNPDSGTGDAAPPDATGEDNANNSPDSGTNGKISIDPNKTDGKTSGSMFAHITTEHCNSACEAFANNLTYFNYCEEVCGITPIKNVSDCDNKKGLEKDYCLKDLGITKKDMSVCDKINDVNLKNTCKNRITQDILENP